MAYFRKRAGGWQVIVRIKGAPNASSTWPSKREAENWATATEAEIRAGLRGAYPTKTLADALDRYEREVTAHKRGKRWESARLAYMRREYPALCAKVLHKMTAADWSAWRDNRLQKVSKGAVQRDINLFRNVWSIAAKEWRWCPEASPFRSIRMPGDNPARERTVTWREARALARRMGYRTGRPPLDKSGELAYLLLLAMATGMRTSELLGLTGETVDLQRRVARLGAHKTLERVGVRYVPLPRRAARLLARLHRPGRLFTLTPASADALFRKYRDQLMIKGLTFRDTRATAITLLSRRVDPLTLARISGHLDLRQLTEVYYRERPEDIAARI